MLANNFTEPTPVQKASLTYLQQHIDLVIAAKTGQGKTLCFGLPILDLLVKRVDRVRARQQSSGDEEEQGEEEMKEGDLDGGQKAEPAIFDSVKALIISPTRELALQIKDMVQAVIPVDYEN